MVGAGGISGMPQTTPTAPAPIDEGFYNSQFYKDYRNDPSSMMGTQDMYTSPILGRWLVVQQVKHKIGLMSNT